jgi:hypothetical protein
MKKEKKELARPEGQEEHSKESGERKPEKPLEMLQVVP